MEVSCYTYGAPRVGDVLTAADYNGIIPLSFRFVNEGDPVPEVPAAGDPGNYRHVRNLVHFSRAGEMRIEPCPRPSFDWQDAARLHPHVGGFLVSVLDVAVTTGASLLNQFAEHNLRRYIANLERAGGQQP